jgi:hypothetical protein
MRTRTVLYSLSTGATFILPTGAPEVAKFGTKTYARETRGSYISGFSATRHVLHLRHLTFERRGADYCI